MSYEGVHIKGPHWPRVPPLSGFKPGDRVRWWTVSPGANQVYDDFAATVIRVTAKRVRIQVDGDEPGHERTVTPANLSRMSLL